MIVVVLFIVFAMLVLAGFGLGVIWARREDSEVEQLKKELALRDEQYRALLEQWNQTVSRN